jgi:hypothetical protein
VAAERRPRALDSVPSAAASFRRRIDRKTNASPRKNSKKISIACEFFLASLGFERIYENHDALARAYGPCGYATT